MGSSRRRGPSLGSYKSPFRRRELEVRGNVSLKEWVEKEFAILINETNNEEWDFDSIQFTYNYIQFVIPTTFHSPGTIEYYSRSIDTLNDNGHRKQRLKRYHSALPDSLDVARNIHFPAATTWDIG